MWIGIVIVAAIIGFQLGKKVAPFMLGALGMHLNVFMGAAIPTAFMLLGELWGWQITEMFFAYSSLYAAMIVSIRTKRIRDIR